MKEKDLRNPNGPEAGGLSFAERHNGDRLKQSVLPMRQPAEGRNGKPPTPATDWQAVLSAHGRQEL